MLKKINDLVDRTSLPFHHKYHLARRPASFYDENIQHDLWELRMNVDPNCWFDYQCRHCGQDEEKQRQCLAKVTFLHSLYIRNFYSIDAENLTLKPNSIENICSLI